MIEEATILLETAETDSMQNLKFETSQNWPAAEHNHLLAGHWGRRQ